MLRAATIYAAAGYPVFPCLPRYKRPLVAHGVLDATTDLAQIQRWWGRIPYANVAIACGAALVAIDIDVKNHARGVETARELFADCGAAIDRQRMRVVTTPSGGLHLWLDFWKGIDPPHSRTAKALGIELKSTGVYVLAPPSCVWIDLEHTQVGHYRFGTVDDLDRLLAA